MSLEKLAPREERSRTEGRSRVRDSERFRFRETERREMACEREGLGVWGAILHWTGPVTFSCWITKFDCSSETS